MVLYFAYQQIALSLHCFSRTGGRCYVCARQTLCMRSSDGSTFKFLREMTLWLPSWKYGVVSEIRLVNRCAFTWRTILPNSDIAEGKISRISPIRFETTESFLKRSPQQEEEQQDE